MAGKSTTKRPVKKKAVSKNKKPNWFQRQKTRAQDLIARRPHRSFRKTSKRAMPYVAPLPGYWAFTKQTFRTVKRFSRSFLIFGALFVIVNLLVIGFVQQENYQFFSETIGTLSSEIAGGDFGKVAQGATLFGIAISGGLNGQLSEVQQLILGFTGILMWLCIVWFLRHRLQGSAVNVRDALYNSTSPLLPMIIISLVALVQLLPAAIGFIVYSVAQSAGVTGGVELMMFSIAGILLVLLSLYWMVGTFIAGIIITIPGTYPFKALSLAGDIVIGRRMQILLRILWLTVLALVIWVVVLLPTILLSGWINISWLPLVQIVLQVLSAATMIFTVTYIYLLYRRMLDEPSHD